MQHLQETGGEVRHCVWSQNATGEVSLPQITRTTDRMTGAGKETPVTNAQRLQPSNSVWFIESRVPVDSQLIS